MIGDRRGEYESEKMAGSTDLSTGSLRHPHLPPGFRFHPTDEELVVHYLKKKASSSPLPVSIVTEVDIYKFDPWELPAKATYGEHEWYFFSQRERKYPNGARPNRAATSGYWKATGIDKPVMSSMRNQKVGVKKSLVFYGGKPPKGTKTSWIMHEYRLLNNKPLGIDFGYKKNSLRLDDWVLCRIYRKNDSRRSLLDQDRDGSLDNMLDHLPSSLTVARQDLQGVSRNLADRMRSCYGPLFDDSHHALSEGMITSFPLLSPAIKPESGTLQPLPSHPSSHLVPMKRQLPSTLYYWEEKDDDHPAEASETSLERYRPLYLQDTGNVCNDWGTGMDSSTGEGSNGIIVSLFSQMQPNSSAFTSLDSDGEFRPPYHLPRSGLNWYAGSTGARAEGKKIT